jgi:DNA repair protein RecN (Recombination protein N)
MISSLSIENYALIEKLSISFTDGFSTITGETGAGKSILLGALGLVLGKRADLSTLKNKDEKCVIEAHFFIEKYKLNSFFDLNELDYENETIIRREILPTGKSRAFINDTPVNLNQLQELGDYLIDIHSQHQTQELSEQLVQFQIIDAIANNNLLVADYQSELKKFKTIQISLKEKKEILSNLLKEQDYNLFLLEELVAAKLENCNLTELENNYEKLNNIEAIKENLSKIISISNSDNFGISQNLKEVKTLIQKTATYSTEFQSISERLESIQIEFEDVYSELENSIDSLTDNPEELEKINQRLQLVYSLQKKHQVQTVEELIQIQNQLENSVLSTSSLETEIEKIEKNILLIETKCFEFGNTIHQNRTKIIPKLTQNLSEILGELGMPNARFDIQLNATKHFYENGLDEIQFLFSANKGSDFGMLKKVASGGEMSRIMLAIKSILSEYSKSLIQMRQHPST